MSDAIELRETLDFKPAPHAPARRVATREMIERIVAGEINERAAVSLDGVSWQPITSIPLFAEAFDAPAERRRVSAPEEATIDLAPMIDVTFLLLLFFMFAATYEKQKTIDTPPPPAEGAVAPPTLTELEEDHLIAQIHADGTLELDERPVGWEKLRKTIERRVRERRTSRMIIIAEDDTDWELVVRLQDEATLAGIEKILFGKGVRPRRE